MWNEPTERQLQRLPGLYETDGIAAADKIIRMHFFLGGCDWYAGEYGPKDRLFFGYAILNNDLQNAEWGYFGFDELRNIRVPPGIEIDRDLHWQSRRALEVDRIRSAFAVQGLLSRS